MHFCILWKKKYCLLFNLIIETEKKDKRKKNLNYFYFFFYFSFYSLYNVNTFFFVFCGWYRPAEKCRCRGINLSYKDNGGVFSTKTKKQKNKKLGKRKGDFNTKKKQIYFFKKEKRVGDKNKKKKEWIINLKILKKEKKKTK